MTHEKGAPEAAGFPSGPWVGYYVYGSSRERHRMDLDLTFRDHLVDGRGSDDISFFLIRGHYDSARLEVTWHKVYPGSHSVYYRGYREGRGIWGTWEIGDSGRGGFMIWPKGAEDGDLRRAQKHETLPAIVTATAAPSGTPRMVG